MERDDMYERQLADAIDDDRQVLDEAEFINDPADLEFNEREY